MTPIPSGLNLIHLRTQLAQRFNLDELQTLCFDLDVNYDNLSGDTLDAKARELIKFCDRHGLLANLIERCQQLHGEVEWVKLAEGEDITSLPEAWDDPERQIYMLVKAFNRNRNQPFSNARTLQGDDIAFRMREAAPLLFGTFDVGAWLNSSSAGKRLAAIKYLDWLQDIEHLDNLLGKLGTERPFVQLHVLITIYNMLDQLDEGDCLKVKARLMAYNVIRNDPSLSFWKKRILDGL